MADNHKVSSKILKHPIAWAPPLLGAILVFLAPPSIADHALIQRLAWFSSSYSGIYEQANHSHFPNQALVFYAITNSAFPFQLVFLFRRMLIDMNRDVTIAYLKRLSFWKRVVLIPAAWIGLIVFYISLFFLVEEPSFCKGCETESLVGMILIRTGGLMLILLMAYSSVTFVRVIPSVFSNPHERSSK